MHPRRRTAVVLALVTLVAALGLGTGPAGAADNDGDGVSNRRDRCPGIRGTRPDGCPDGRWRLRNSNTAGVADISFLFGSLAWVPVAGDWDGDTVDTSGLYNGSTGQWRLFEFGTEAVQTFTYRPAPLGSLPVVGDWDGDGDDTVALYSPDEGRWYLRNSNSGGAPDLVFDFGGRSSERVRPVAGDWNGDTVDTVGLFKRDTKVWRLRNTNAAGPYDIRFTFGGGVRPVVGDWDGDGDDTVGVAQPDADVDGNDFLAWQLRNTNSGGSPDLQFVYNSGTPVVGDWDGDDDDTVGVRRR